LNRADCAPDIEYRIRVAKAGRVQGARKYNGLPGNVAKHPGRLDHRIGTVCDQDVGGIGSGNSGVDQLPLLIPNVQTVLAHQGGYLDVEGHMHCMQDLADLRLTDLIVAFIVEIDLVDGAAGCDDEQF